VARDTGGFSAGGEVVARGRRPRCLRASQTQLVHVDRTSEADIDSVLVPTDTAFDEVAKRFF
jgi:hypothetical protein